MTKRTNQSICTFSLFHIPLFMTTIHNIMSEFEPIRLEQMAKVKLMNRVDTKFVTSLRRLIDFLGSASEFYRAQEIDGKRVCSYTTEYFDTPAMDMYTMHHNGCLGRQKVRIRSYVDSQLHFLEVKTKNNHRRTKKKHVAIEAGGSIFSPENQDFLSRKCWFEPSALIPALNNSFSRVTLVNNDMTERLTIDTNLSYDNPLSGRHFDFDGICIIEIKRDGLSFSPALGLLNNLRIFPHGFSKYCIGTVLTNPDVKHNRFKEKLIEINKALK